MKITVSPDALKRLDKLPLPIRKKFTKQVSFLITNPKHPSLHGRKMADPDSFEARIDLHYRFTFVVTGENILILTIGPHDEGLGKK